MSQVQTDLKYTVPSGRETNAWCFVVSESTGYSKLGVRTPGCAHVYLFFFAPLSERGDSTHVCSLSSLYLFIGRILDCSAEGYSRLIMSSWCLCGAGHMRFISGRTSLQGCRSRSPTAAARQKSETRNRAATRNRARYIRVVTGRVGASISSLRPPKIRVFNAAWGKPVPALLRRS